MIRNFSKMESGFIPQLLVVIGFLIATLIGLVGWIGNRLFLRMDTLHELLRLAEKDLHVRLDNHETRITRAEAHLSIFKRPSCHEHPNT